MQTSRDVYVISDLHIGGRYGRRPGDRGFRICTRVDALRAFVEHIVADERPAGVGLELVIAGDFVDFLAEEDEATGGARSWKPIIHAPDEAVRRLDEIVARDRGFFDALKALLAKGHALTVLLGNHDVELSYPAVADALRRHLGADARAAFRFLYDDQGYRVGDAWIEHGNRYDGFNRIDHEALRLARAMQARGEPTDEGPFDAPPGSRLVAFVMNPLKASYPFLDLLKPETEAVLPILAAMVPGVRWKLPYVLWLKAQASLRLDIAARAGAGAEDDEGRGADVAAGADEDADDEAPVRRRRAPRKSREQREEEMLVELLAKRMTRAGAEAFLQKLAEEEAAERAADAGEEGDEDVRYRAKDIAAPSPHILRLLGSIDPRGLRARLPALLDSLRVVQNDHSFDITDETEKDYLEGAQARADEGGHRYVIFGHTHLAKRVPLERGATYLNSGTWADLIAFPKSVFQGDDTQAQAELLLFLDDLESGNLDRYIRFEPTYVRLDVRGDRVERADLLTWKG